MSRRLEPRWAAYTLAALVVVLDQTSKAWAEQSLPSGVMRPLLPGLLDLQLVYNRGAAFSLLTQATGLLGLISAAVAVAIGVWLWRQRQLPPLQLAAAGLLLGGTLGNGLDRWRLGAVVDFLALVPIDFPVFNLADVAINLAVVCMALTLLQSSRSHDN
jgi:signal peptidase II